MSILPHRSESSLEEVLSLFVKLGGKVVDSSPMYGRAEEVVGDIAAKLGLRDSLFLATKVWTRGKQAGIESMERSLARLQTKRIDLMQVHNLVDVATQLATMRDWKAQGRIRYIGVTHYNSSAYGEVEKILRSEKLDFLQINYSIMEREAEERILAAGAGTRRRRDRESAFWRRRFISARSRQTVAGMGGRIRLSILGAILLKWIVAHSVVTCAIPATSNPKHLEDNMQAGMGRLPDAKMRQRMVEFVAAL